MSEQASPVKALMPKGRKCSQELIVFMATTSNCERKSKHRSEVSMPGFRVGRKKGGVYLLTSLGGISNDVGGSSRRRPD